MYTAAVEVDEGRSGRARSRTGALDVALTRPAERGPGDTGTDPEELFAAGYAACFRSALGVVARRRRVALGEASVTASVTLTSAADGAYGLSVELRVRASGLPTARLRELTAAAHLVCPYSRAVRGNVPVLTEAIGSG
nr:Ohr family peroxiredoxin [Streptomyces radicis]